MNRMCLFAAVSLYLHYISRQTLEVWRLRRSVDKNLSGKTSGILTGRQHIQEPSLQHGNNISDTSAFGSCFMSRSCDPLF